MIKKILALVLTLTMVAVSLAGCGTKSSGAESQVQSSQPASGGTAEFQPVELSLATGFGTSHAFYRYLEEFANEVSSATDGNITITLYPSNTLVGAADMHSAVVNGVVDMVETDVAYDVAAFPLSSATYLPNYKASSSKTFTYAFNEFYQSDLAEFDGMKILWAYGMTPFAILSNKEIKTLEDLKGLQIRATGFALAAMTALGASPIGMPISETYEAAQKGTVQAICNSYETLKGWNFAEVVKYGTKVTGISTGNHYIAINEDVWNSFPAEYQQAITEASAQMVDKVAGVFDEIDVEGEAFGKEKGVVFSELTEAEQARWNQTLQPLIDKWLEEKTAMGLDAQGTYDGLVELVNKYAAIYG
jgi:TRAP-type C4-dicarboxylate transport system substrate-binding protein